MVALLTIAVGGSCDAGAIKGSLDLVSLDVGGGKAVFDLTAIFENAGDFGGVNIHLSGSESPEGVPLTDWSNFSFTPSLSPGGRLDPDWITTSDFGPGIPDHTFIAFAFPDIVSVTPFDSVLLGELTFDFGAEGIGVGDSFVVSVLSTAVIFRAPPEIPAFVELEFDDPGAAGRQVITIPGAGMVPEASTGTVFLGVVAFGAMRRRRRPRQR